MAGHFVFVVGVQGVGVFFSPVKAFHTTQTFGLQQDLWFFLLYFWVIILTWCNFEIKKIWNFHLIHHPIFTTQLTTPPLFAKWKILLVKQTENFHQQGQELEGGGKGKSEQKEGGGEGISIAKKKRSVPWWWHYVLCVSKNVKQLWVWRKKKLYHQNFIIFSYSIFKSFNVMPLPPRLLWDLTQHTAAHTHIHKLSIFFHYVLSGGGLVFFFPILNATIPQPPRTKLIFLYGEIKVVPVCFLI